MLPLRRQLRLVIEIMLKFVARRMIASFAKRWNYDTAYMTVLLERGGIGALAPLDALGKVSSYRKDVPTGPYFAAKITAAVAADCGPCAQLIVSMAEAAGVDLATLRALAAGHRDALGESERLGFDLAKATLAREDARDIREEILERWGIRGLASLGYAIVSAQAFPAFKYAIGEGHACVRLSAGGVDLLRREAGLA